MNPLHYMALHASHLEEEDFGGFQYVETHLGSRLPSTEEDDTADDYHYDDLDHTSSNAPSSEDTSQDHDTEGDLDQDADYTDQYLVPEVRYHSVLVGIHSGKSHTEISKETGIPRSTVGSIKKRWATKGSVDDGRKHNGRPPKLTADQLRQIEETLQESRNTISSTELLKLLKFNVSARTIRRAKKAIVERRCLETRNTVVMAARSLAAAAAAASAEHNSRSSLINLNPFRPPVSSWPATSST